MKNILAIRTLDAIGQLAEPWDRLRKKQARFFPDFHDLKDFLAETSRKFLILAVKDDDSITCLACFVYQRTHKKYTLGARRLFSLPIREVHLFGSDILGVFDANTFSHFAGIVRREFTFDVLSLGEVIIDSNLHTAVDSVNSRFLVTSPHRKNSIRWLIRFPKTFDDYMMSLSAESRQSIRRKLRKFEASFGRDFHVICRPDQVESFLSVGEAISRLTYQWNVGQRLCNDEPTRRAYLRQAERGTLRCYLLYADGKPCAFLRGELLDSIFHYETPGFDPQYSKSSPGTVALMWALKDLIENTACEVFDFGLGGDDTGYKAMFGNVAMNARSIQLSHRFQPYSRLVIGVEESLTAVKNLASWALGDSEIRKRLMRFIRKYNTST